MNLTLSLLVSRIWPWWGQGIEESGGYLGASKYDGPFAEAQFGGDHDTGRLVELAQQVDQQCAAPEALNGRWPNAVAIWALPVPGSLEETRLV